MTLDKQECLIFSLEVLDLLFLGGFRWYNQAQNPLLTKSISWNVFPSLTLSHSGPMDFSLIFCYDFVTLGSCCVKRDLKSGRSKIKGTETIKL